MEECLDWRIGRKHAGSGLSFVMSVLFEGLESFRLSYLDP